MTVRKILYMISYSCIGHLASPKPVEAATTALAESTSQTAQISS